MLGASLPSLLASIGFMRANVGPQRSANWSHFESLVARLNFAQLFTSSRLQPLPLAFRTTSCRPWTVVEPILGSYWQMFGAHLLKYAPVSQRCPSFKSMQQPTGETTFSTILDCAQSSFQTIKSLYLKTSPEDKLFRDDFSTQKFEH